MKAEIFSLDHLTGFVRQAHAMGLSESEAASLVHQHAVQGILNQEHVKAAMIRTVNQQVQTTGVTPGARYFTPESQAMAFDCAVKFSNNPACVQFRKLAGVPDPEISLEHLPEAVKQTHLRLKQASGFDRMPLSRQIFLAGVLTAAESIPELPCLRKQAVQEPAPQFNRGPGARVISRSVSPVA